MFDYADAIDRLPGATPVRARLVKDALTYLDNLSKDANTPQLQREIVNAYVRVSDVQGNEYENNLGDTAASVDSARKAVDAAEKLLREDTTQPALDSAASAFSTYGDMLYSIGDLLAVERPYRRAISLREEIAAKSPLDLDNNLALSACFWHMGDLSGGSGFQSLGRTADALALYQQGHALLARMLAQFPGKEEIAKENYKSLISLSAAERSLEMRREDAHPDICGRRWSRIEEIHAAHPDDVNVKVELAIVEARIGQILLDSGEAAAAIPRIVRSAALLQERWRMRVRRMQFIGRGARWWKFSGRRLFLARKARMRRRFRTMSAPCKLRRLCGTIRRLCSMVSMPETMSASSRKVCWRLATRHTRWITPWITPPRRNRFFARVSRRLRIRIRFRIAAARC